MQATTGTPVIIEAAINGANTKDRNPNIPITPEDIARDAHDSLTCAEATELLFS
jgi:uncharacterized protein (DUF849 family)